MKNTILRALLIGILILLNQSPVFGAETPEQTVPLAVIPIDRYDFEPVPEGNEVIHDYIVLNKGTAPLAIEKVKTG